MVMSWTLACRVGLCNPLSCWQGAEPGRVDKGKNSTMSEKMEEWEPSITRQSSTVNREARPAFSHFFWAFILLARLSVFHERQHLSNKDSCGEILAFFF